MFKFKFRLFPLGFLTGMFDPEKLLEVIREGCQDGYRILRREFTFETRRKFGIFMLPAFGMVFRREEKNQDAEHDYRLATYCTRFFTRTVNLKKLQETLDNAADGGFEMYYAMKYPARFLLIFPREAYMFIFRKPYSGEGKQYKYFIQQTPYRFFTKTIDPQRYENELNQSGAKGQIKRTFRDERRVFGIFRQQTVVAVFETTSQGAYTLNWKGRALDPGLPNGRSECTLRLSGTNLIAEIPDGEDLTLNLGDVDYIVRGYDKKEYVFRKKNAHHPLVSTYDIGLIKTIQGSNIIEFNDAFHRFKKDTWASRRRKYIIPLVMLITLVVGGTWFVAYPAVDMAVAVTPISVDREVGKIAIADLVQNEVSDPVVTGAIQKIVDRLTKHVPEKEFHFNVHVIDNPMINAFAAPGGEIVVMTGLIKESDSAEEVAGVLAHEISHVTERHGLEKIYRQAIFIIALNVIVGDAGALAEIALDGASNLANLGFSRSMEREADLEGHHLLVKAGIDPSGLRSFFEKLAEKHEHNENAAVRLLSTHPLSKDRVHYLEEKEKELQKNFEKLDIDWQAVKDKLK